MAENRVDPSSIRLTDPPASVIRPHPARASFGPPSEEDFLKNMPSRPPAASPHPSLASEIGAWTGKSAQRLQKYAKKLNGKAAAAVLATGLVLGGIHALLDSDSDSGAAAPVSPSLKDDFIQAATRGESPQARRAFEDKNACQMGVAAGVLGPLFQRAGGQPLDRTAEEMRGAQQEIARKSEEVCHAKPDMSADERARLNNFIKDQVTHAASGTGGVPGGPSL